MRDKAKNLLTVANLQGLHLSWAQQQGIKLGLTIKDVNTLNFGRHTLSVLTNMLKLKPELGVKDAFSRIKGMTSDQSEVFWAELLQENIKFPALSEMKLIRV